MKKKALKILVIFRAFLFIFFRPLDPKSDKKSRKSTNKKIWPYILYISERSIYTRWGKTECPDNDSKIVHRGKYGQKLSNYTKITQD